MYTVRYGGKKGKAVKMLESDHSIAVRTQDGSLVVGDSPLDGPALSGKAWAVLSEFERVASFHDAGVEVLRLRRGRNPRELRDRARSVLKQEPGIRFAGRVLLDSRAREPVVYTENLFIKFGDDRAESAGRKLLKTYGLIVKRELAYARNAFFVEAPEGTGLKLFEVAEKLLAEPIVELCHTELVRRTRKREAFAPQWHLRKTTVGGNVIDQHANVEAAWAMAQGEGTVIAVIDDGVDIDHEEFRSPGKIVAPLYASVSEGHPNRTNPRPGRGANHGTACAGVACADGLFGASGVAPKARLMPIRLTSGLGSQAEADAIIHAAKNGADVISCSWGPDDGEWWNPDDPVHKEVVPIPDSTRLAIDWAIQNGRNGRGCVFTWAAGNGNESVDNDGYASNDRVIAVAACNDTGTKSAYSDFGKAVWCAFPSSHGDPSRTPGIWTTDRSGASGYNTGKITRGDAEGNYINSFGGTSSACPGVAGVAALLLSRNPDLRWDQVKDLIRRSCDRIDPEGGQYAADGHSAWYGYGRVNAQRALELALPPKRGYTVVHTAVQDVTIEDLTAVSLEVIVGDEDPIKAVRVGVDIEHTYIGDLVVRVKPPQGLGGTVVLHDKEADGTQNLRKVFDTVSTPALAQMVGKKPKGGWKLEVEDTAKQDSGILRSFTVEFEL
jgi:subtilisin family serine protease